MNYQPVIGIEIHVQLRTRTKMFCGCALSFGEEPNTLVCPVCLGHPGTLPVTNAEAVHYGLMIAMAFDCEIAPRSIFHRKNYFYPDLPKGYQISQYDIPLGRSGRLGDVRIHRVHLEEDAAKLIHAGSSGRIHGASTSVVDFNRGGTPLVEIVTEPDLTSAAQAAEFGRLLQATLRRMGVSDVNMEEGSLRMDANVSIRPAGTATLGTKTELKNMNSFRFLERGIDAEIARQEQILGEGGEVEQETLHYDPQSGALTSLRSKEEAHDYRYFPEPDLVPIAPTEEMLERARSALPELPAARAERLERDLQLPAETARLLAFRSELGDFFESAVAASDNGDTRILANWMTNELAARIGDADPASTKLEPAALASLVAMVGEKRVSAGAAREVLDVLVAEGGDPASVVEAKGLGRAESGELDQIVDQAIADNPDAVEKIRAGKAQAIGAIVGAVMRETKGRADGGEVQRMINERIWGLAGMGRTIRVEESVQIARPPADVWNAIADYGFDSEWRNGLREMTPDPSGPPAVGTKVHEVVRSSGRDYVADCAVTELDPGVSYRFAGTGTIGGLEGGRAVRPDSAGGGAVFTYTIEMQPTGGTRLLSPLLGPMVRSGLKKDLDRLRVLLEDGRGAA